MLMLVKGFWKGLLDYWDPRSDGIASMEILTKGHSVLLLQ